MELDDSVHNQVTILSEEGDAFVENGNYDDAIKKYKSALNLLPAPKNQWEAGTWLYVAIGDAFFFAENYKATYDYFMDALNCPDATDNPFIHLRVGQALYHLENEAGAVDALLKAYMLDGEEVFEAEDDMYLEFLKSKVNL